MSMEDNVIDTILEYFNAFSSDNFYYNGSSGSHISIPYKNFELRGISDIDAYNILSRLLKPCFFCQPPQISQKPINQVNIYGGMQIISPSNYDSGDQKILLFKTDIEKLRKYKEEKQNKFKEGFKESEIDKKSPKTKDQIKSIICVKSEKDYHTSYKIIINNNYKDDAEIQVDRKHLCWKNFFDIANKLPLELDENKGFLDYVNSKNNKIAMKFGKNKLLKIENGYIVSNIIEMDVISHKTYMIRKNK